MKKLKTYISVLGILIAYMIVSCFSFVQAAETFPVTRLSGQDRYGTAAAISRAGWNTADYVIITTGAGDDKFADALAGTPLAYALNAPILLTGAEGLNEDTKAEIKRLKAKNAYLLGGAGVIPENTAEQIREMGLTVKRLWGADRNETAVQISEELRKLKSFEKVFITTGEEFQYAMMIASFAARRNIPILFTGKTALSYITETKLKEWGIKNAEIIGNTQVISGAVEEKLKSMGLSVKRIQGADIVETNIEVIKNYGSSTGSLAIARDDVFVDALAGAPLAAAKDINIILTGKESINSKLLNFIKGQKLSSIHVFGGPGAVSENVVSIIKGENVEISGEMGNTAGNIQHDGLAAFSDGWIYYFKSANRIYKIKTDGSAETKICDDFDSYYINAVNGWVYYSNGMDRYKLYKIRMDGSSRTKISDDAARYTIVSGDWIYYIKGGDISKDWQIVKIKTDGTGREIYGERASIINVDGSWIYYTNMDDGNKLYKIKTDGTGKAKLSDDAPEYIQNDEDWIYYSIRSEEAGYNDRLIKMKKDGSGKTEFSNENSYGSFNISGDWIYYANSRDGSKIYKIKKDGTGNTRLNNSRSSCINIAGGWIYYLKSEENEHVPYRMRFDGSADTPVNAEVNAKPLQAKEYRIEWIKEPQYDFDDILWVCSNRTLSSPKFIYAKKAYTSFIAKKSNKFGVIGLNAEIIKSIEYENVGCVHCVILNVNDDFKNLKSNSTALSGDYGHGLENDYFIYDKDRKQFFDTTREVRPVEPREFTEKMDDAGLIMFKYGTVRKNGNAYELINEGPNYGFVNSIDEVVIDAKYPEARLFQEGYIAVKGENGKWGFIDTDGNSITEFKYDYAGNFNEGYAVVCVNNKWGYIDTTGFEYITPQYQGATEIVNGQCFVKENGLWGIAKIR